MKVKYQFLSALCALLISFSCNINTQIPPSPATKIAALTHLMHEQNQAEPNSMESNNVIKTIFFYNDIPAFLQLRDDFGSNPEFLKRFIDHFSFTINDYEIPPDSVTPVPVRKEGFKFSIIVKRGKIASLLAFAKASTQDWIKSACTKVMNLFSHHITYDCPLQEHNLHQNNIHRMADLIFEHPDMLALLNDPNNFLTVVKKGYISWLDWSAFNIQLPRMENT